MDGLKDTREPDTTGQEYGPSLGAVLGIALWQVELSHPVAELFFTPRGLVQCPRKHLGCQFSRGQPCGKVKEAQVALSLPGLCCCCCCYCPGPKQTPLRQQNSLKRSFLSIWLPSASSSSGCVGWNGIHRKSGWQVFLRRRTGIFNSFVLRAKSDMNVPLSGQAKRAIFVGPSWSCGPRALCLLCFVDKSALIQGHMKKTACSSKFG